MQWAAPSDLITDIAYRGLRLLQILVAGGSYDYCPDNLSPANNESYLIDVRLPKPSMWHSGMTDEETLTLCCTCFTHGT